MSDYAQMMELAMQYAPEGAKEKAGLVRPPADKKDAHAEQDHERSAGPAAATRDKK